MQGTSVALFFRTLLVVLLVCTLFVLLFFSVHLVQF